MKQIITLTICFFSVLSAFAQEGKNSANFTAQVFWEKPDFNYNGSFSPLEQLGVMKSAEQKAQAKCAQAGYTHCCIIESHITSCNGWNGQLTCEGSATVRGSR